LGLISSAIPASDSSMKLPLIVRLHSIVDKTVRLGFVLALNIQVVLDAELAEWEPMCARPKKVKVESSKESPLEDYAA
jgi:hypothetical protein